MYIHYTITFENGITYTDSIRYKPEPFTSRAYLETTLRRKVLAKISSLPLEFSATDLDSTLAACNSIVVADAESSPESEPEPTWEESVWNSLGLNATVGSLVWESGNPGSENDVDKDTVAVIATAKENDINY